MPARPYPRFAAALVRTTLKDSPVTLIHGPRQCGKTTLAQAIGARAGYDYVTFDADAVRNAATMDPWGFVSGLPAKVILDEVHRVPTLFAALKMAVDRDRRPGHFLLTGSANVLLVPALSDSLAGRMEILRLHPLSQAELERREPAFLRRLLHDGFPFDQTERLGARLVDIVLGGGYPPALARSPERRAAWYRSYVESLAQRDVREMSRIGALEIVPRLIAAAAAQTSQLFNATELTAPFQVSRPTIRDYVTLLERVFLVTLLPPWHTNRLSRLVKTPKLHMGDSGIAAAVLGLSRGALLTNRTAFGPLLETFVFQELCRQASWRADPVSFFHFRDKDGVEVDVVAESEGLVAGVEVKAGATVTASDFRGLRKLAEAAGSRFARGVVLYDGETCAPFGDRLHAVPIRALWERG